MSRAHSVFIVVLIPLMWSASAVAYRPFDSTDADVVSKGEFELELGPAGYVWEGRERALVAPAFVANLGVADDWEAVFEGRRLKPLGAGASSSQFIDDQFSLKGVLRRGSLQDEAGPSVATEFAILLPETAGPTAVGFSGAAIVSERCSWGAAHFNAKITRTREHDSELFLGGILEGPADWNVRPVAEVFYERNFRSGYEVSALGGAIWQIHDSLSLDLAYRHGWTDAMQSHEVRLGLTLAFQMLR